MIQNPSDGEFLVVWDDDIVQSALGNIENMRRPETAILTNFV